MKRVISIILSLILVALCFASTSASAKSISNKLTAVQEALDNMVDDDKIEAGVFLYCIYNEDEIAALAHKETGAYDMDNLEEQYAFRNAYNKILSEYELKASEAFIEKLAIPEEDIIYCSSHAYIEAKLTKAMILEAASYSEVESIFLLSDHEPQAPAEDSNAVGELYKESFLNQCEDLETIGNLRVSDISEYRELYYHKDENGEVDWTLVYARNYYFIQPWIHYTQIGNRILVTDGYLEPFHAGYGVYDVKQGVFKDCYAKWEFDPADYPGFTRAFDEYGVVTGPYIVNKLLGDLDGDDDLTSVDCTLIQRCATMVCDWPEDDLISTYGNFSEFRPLKYFSDFDRDGERDLVDATRLQRYVTMID